MYAIIKSGGKQAKVSPGDVIEVELLHTQDESVSFTPILVVDDQGSTISDKDSLSKASVTAKVLGDVKGPKLDIFKYKNKSGYRRRKGHRQQYTSLEVTGIDLPGGAKKSKKPEPAKAPAAEKTEAPVEDASEEE
ncbi:MAG: 50S ribosomal protein L21 [Acidimicrobiia bacterium]|nr:50S ribosomal protein L21 [Acidimicrobiia bacterium]